MPTKYDLQLFQRLPLDIKIAKTKLRIPDKVARRLLHNPQVDSRRMSQIADRSRLV